MADILHITLAELRAIEDEEIKLSQSDISDFATALEVTVDYLKRGCIKEQTGVIDIEQATLENSPVTNNSNSGNTTNNFYGSGEGNNQAQLDHIEAQQN